jgi:hypothetical protein
MHDHRHIEPARELLGCRKMIRVRMRIDQIPDAHAVLRSQCEVAVIWLSSGSINAAAQVFSQPMT